MPSSTPKPSATRRTLPPQTRAGRTARWRMGVGKHRRPADLHQTRPPLRLWRESVQHCHYCTALHSIPASARPRCNHSQDRGEQAPRLPSSFTSIIAPFPAWGESFPLTPNTESAELDRLNTTTTRVGMRLNSRPDSKTSHFQKGRKTESRRPITRKAPIHRSRRAPRNKAPRDHHSHHAPQSREPRMRPKSPAADWAPT